MQKKYLALLVCSVALLLASNGARADSMTTDAAGNVTLNVSLINGDVNGDNQIGASDLFAIRSDWGKTTDKSSFPNADLNGDGQIGASDLFIVRMNWGQSGQQ